MTRRKAPSNHTTATVSELGELGVIALARSILETGASRNGSGQIGIGDDCAVMPFAALGIDIRGSLLLTTDTMVEGRHFRFDLSSPAHVGWKLLAVSVSDIAAMGGIPLCAVITIQLPRELPIATIEGFYHGLHELAIREGVQIVGGDTVEGKELAVGLTLLGRSDGSPILRRNARPGDKLYVTGKIGSAGAGLALLERMSRDGSLESNYAGDAPLLERHRRPDPRRLLGQLLAKERIPTAMIDVSDGLAHDAAHIARESGVDIEIDLWRIPRHARTAETRSVLQSITDGDDYELLFSAPEIGRPSLDRIARDADEITEIGRVTERRGDSSIVLLRETEESAAVPAADLFRSRGLAGDGFEHFRS